MTTTWRQLTRPMRSFLAARHCRRVAGAVVLVALGSHCSARSNSAAPPGPTVPECDAYASRVEQCMGANTPAAHEASAQAAALANADDATRARMKETCATDLKRLATACH